MKTEVKKSTNYKKSNIINKFYIDNSEKLSELIKNKVFPENIPDDIIYDIFKSKYSDFDKLLKLHKKARGCFFQIENIKYYFLLTKPDLIDLYHSYLKKQEEIIELRLHIKIIAIANSKGSCFIDVQSFLKNDGLPNDMQVEILNDNIIKITISTKNISEERLFIEKSKKELKILSIYIHMFQKLDYEYFHQSLKEFQEE